MQVKALNARSTVKRIPLKTIPLQPVKAVPDLAPASPDPAATAETSNLPKKRPISLALKTVSSPDSVPNNLKIEPESNQPRPVRPTSLTAPLTSRPTSLSGLGDLKEISAIQEKSYEVQSEFEGRKRIAQQALPPVARPTSLSGGLPITPLMAKLSHLAMDRYGNVGTPLGDPTPCEPKDVSFPNRGW